MWKILNLYVFIFVFFSVYARYVYKLVFWNSNIKLLCLHNFWAQHCIFMLPPNFYFAYVCTVLYLCVINSIFTLNAIMPLLKKKQKKLPTVFNIMGLQTLESSFKKCCDRRGFSLKRIRCTSNIIAVYFGLA